MDSVLRRLERSMQKLSRSGPESVASKKKVKPITIKAMLLKDGEVTVVRHNHKEGDEANVHLQNELKKRLKTQIPVEVVFSIDQGMVHGEYEESYALTLETLELDNNVEGDCTLKMFPHWTLVMTPSTYRIDSDDDRTSFDSKAFLMVSENAFVASCVEDFEEWLSDENKFENEHNVFESEKTMDLMGFDLKHMLKKLKDGTN
tara:strand:- start:157 stop:765 length:609 start_codon:yes stop_codon:yes gene_type:complete